MNGMILQFVTLLIVSTSSVVLRAAPKVVPTKEAFANVIDKHKSLDVLFVGDTDHANYDLWKAFGSSLSSLKAASSHLDCVLLEYDRRAQPAFDKYRTSSDQGLQALLNEIPGVATLNPTKRVRATEAVLIAAKASNLRVYAADIDFSSDIGKQILDEMKTLKFFFIPEFQRKMFEDVILTRNHFFSETIIRLKQDKECNQMVLLIGADHLRSEPIGFPGFASVPLQTLVENSGLTSASALLNPIKCADTPPSQSCIALKKASERESLSALDVSANAVSEASFLILAP